MYNILRWFGNIVGETRQGMKTGAQDLERGILSAPNDSSSDFLDNDREDTPSPSNRSVDELFFQTSGPPHHEPSDEPTAQSDSEATQMPHYAFSEENKIAAMENIVSILLTEDTLKLIGHTILENKAYKTYESEYEDVKERAAKGEAFIKVQQSELDDANLAEDVREHIKQDIEDARPRVLQDIEQRDEMERELGIRKAGLEYRREHLDDMMQRLMTDFGVFERPEPEDQVDEGRTTHDNEGSNVKHTDPAGVSESNSTQTVREARTSESTVSGTSSTAWKARVRLETAADRVSLAQGHFDRRHDYYLADLEELGHDHSRTEIDHFWFRKGAELARELRDAEEEFDQARAEAMALDLLATTPHQEFDFRDEEDDGYRESEDPVCDADQVNRSFIEAWTAKVQEGQEEQDLPTPAIEWEAESVNMSESVSAINECSGWRKAIDKWHAQQESLRAQFAVLPESEP